MSNILTVNIGSSSLGLALFEDDELIQKHYLSVHSKSENELVQYLENISKPLSCIQAYVASVRPSLTELVCHKLEGYLKIKPVLLSYKHFISMPVDVAEPASVGIDRLLNAFAARSLFGAPVVCVDFGTATTIDIIDKKGAFIGGIIACGIETSAHSISQATEQIKEYCLTPTKQLIGGNTEEAVLSGLLFGHAAMIDGLIAKVKNEINETPQVVFTGGLSRIMEQYCSCVSCVQPDLTFHGINMLASQIRERNG